MSTTTSGGDGGALYWAHRYKGERNEWQRCAEEIFRAAVKVEQERDSYRRAFECAKELLARHDGECERIAGERDESDAVVSMLSACLLDAEREVEEQAAEIVALRNRLDVERATLTRERAVAWGTAEEFWTARDAATDYHAAWRDAEERIASLTRNGERIVAECHSCGELSCGTAEEARERVLAHLLECPVHPIRQVERERDEADRALSMERAAHWVTADRLARLASDVRYRFPYPPYVALPTMAECGGYEAD
jgi:predicted phage tail protein